MYGRSDDDSEEEEEAEATEPAPPLIQPALRRQSSPPWPPLQLASPSLMFKPRSVLIAETRRVVRNGDGQARLTSSPAPTVQLLEPSSTESEQNSGKSERKHPDLAWGVGHSTWADQSATGAPTSGWGLWLHGNEDNSWSAS